MRLSLFFAVMIFASTAYALQLQCSGDVTVAGVIDPVQSTMSLTVSRAQPAQVETVQAAIQSVSLSDYIDVAHYPDIQTYKGIAEVNSAEFQSSVFPYAETVNIYFTDFHTADLQSGIISKAFFVSSYDNPDSDRGDYQVDHVTCSLN